MQGLAAVTRTRVGEGSIVVLGTTPSGTDLAKLISLLEPDTGVAPVAQASDHLLVVPRSGDAGEGLVAVEMMNRPAELKLARPAVDLLTGDERTDAVDVPAYGVVVLKYTE